MIKKQNSKTDRYFDNPKQVMLTLSSVSGVFLVCIMATIFYLVLAVVGDFNDDKKLPKAQAGIIDLSSVTLDNDLTIPLSGDWLFAPGKLLSHSGFTDALTNQESDTADIIQIKVPGTWRNNIVDGKPLSNYGAGTYRLTVTLDRKYEHLSLYIPPIGTAHKLFVNEQLISEVGKVSRIDVDAEPALSAGVHSLLNMGKELNITIQVSNYDYFWSGLWSNMRLGSEESLHQEQYRKVLQSTFIIGIFFTIAVFNLIQFSLRPESNQPILIAFIAILLGLRELEISFILEISNIYSFSFEAGRRINFITFFLPITPLVLYFYSRLSTELNRFVIYSLCFISITCTLVAIFTPPVFFSNLANPYQIFCLVVVMYIVYGLIKAVLRKRENANVLLFGSTVLFGFLVNDVLLSLRVIESVALMNFGLVAFVMCQNYLTYTYFINAGVQNEILNINLSAKNQALEELSGNLEQQVSERTKALEGANEKLERLVNEDPLTGLLNRRGLLPFFTQARSDFDNKRQPFAIMIIDFDHFKNLNDTHGHHVGDTVLESGAQLMKSLVSPPSAVGRWGGEEFIVICACATAKEAAHLGETIRAEIFKKIGPEVDFPVSITVGIAQISNDETTDGCIKRADEALYQGKQNGRNRVEVAQANQA